MPTCVQQSPSTRLSNASPTLGWVQEAEENPGAREAMGLLRVYGRPFPSLILGPICKPEGAVTRILTVPDGLGSTPNSAISQLNEGPELCHLHEDCHGACYLEESKIFPLVTDTCHVC